MTKEKICAILAAIKKKRFRSHRQIFKAVNKHSAGSAFAEAAFCVKAYAESLFSHIFYFYFWRYPAIKTNNDNEQLINEEITRSGISMSKNVRVIGASGEQLGIITLSKALQNAYSQNLDLVLMSAQSDPPVCKIMDYGKFRFDRDKKKKEARKKQQKVSVKEIQLTWQIDVNDFNTKVNNAKRFLTSGNKVKVLVIFKGRQMMHQEVGKNLLDKFVESVSQVGALDKPASLEGRAMSVFISPIKQTPAK